MKARRFETTVLGGIVIAFLLAGIAEAASGQASDNAPQAPAGKVAAGPYFGQRPPERAPCVFAPGVVSRGNIHSRLTISPDGRRMLWNTFDLEAGTTQILCTMEVNGRWTEPAPPPFAKEGSTQTPVFSPDGKQLHFKVQTEKGWSTRFVEVTDAGWGPPRADGALLNCSASFARSGRAYLSDKMKAKVWGTGIFSARYSEDGLSDPRPLEASINIPNAIDYTPFVSPDEAILLFTSNRPLTGDKEDMHIYASFRQGDGSWANPVRVSDIQARFPSLSPDGRYLFFCGDDGNIYWVDATILELLRPPAESREVRKEKRS